MMRVKLGHIADIRTGYTIRTELDWKSQGERLLLQMSDFESLKKGSFDKLKTTNMKTRIEWMLEEKDLLIKARGTDLVPLVVPKDVCGAVYAHPLLRIRVDKRQANPEFIAWLLSLPNIQNKLNRMTAGTSMQMIKLDHLKNLEFNLPSLELQNKLCEVVRLLNREKKLLNLLQNKRMQFVSYMLEKVSIEESIELAKIQRMSNES